MQYMIVVCVSTRDLWSGYTIKFLDFNRVTMSTIKFHLMLFANCYQWTVELSVFVNQMSIAC